MLSLPRLLKNKRRFQFDLFDASSITPWLSGNGWHFLLLKHSNWRMADLLPLTVPPSPMMTPSLSTIGASDSIGPLLSLPAPTSNARTPQQLPPAFGPSTGCAGSTVDYAASGIITTAIFSLAIGLIIWLLFAYLRPRFPQIYGVRSWFVRPELRPAPLRNTFWAFLFPPVPMAPNFASDVPEALGPLEADAKLFPSDEELTQRVLWVAFLLVLGWTVLGLVGALPLYLIATPCIGQSATHPQRGGGYTTLQDLSLLRLLQVLDHHTTFVGASISQTRAIVDSIDEAANARIRLIILAVLVLVLAVLPAMRKIYKEFNNLAAHRRRWLDIKCDGIDMVWVRAEDAPGFIGWGEAKIKEFLTRNGLSVSLGGAAGSPVRGERTLRRNDSRRSQRNEAQETEKALPGIDVKGIFSVSDTYQLSILVEERDRVLNNLEAAEAQYISSFRLSAPSPIGSTVDIPETPLTEESSAKLKISRPFSMRRHASKGATDSSTVVPPTSYIAPSSYYKLRSVQGITNRRNSETGASDFESKIHQRVVESRLQGVERDSIGLSRFSLGGLAYIDEDETLATPGSHGRTSFGPNQIFASPAGSDLHSRTPESMSFTADVLNGDFFGQPWNHSMAERPLSSGTWNSLRYPSPNIPSATQVPSGSRWGPESPSSYASTSPPARSSMRPESSATSYFQNVPKPEINRQETFPMRAQDGITSLFLERPLHLRAQEQQPFIRPHSGMDHETLGIVYNDIRNWRSKLKALNSWIADMQQETFSGIAEGARVRGWLIYGRGVRFLPGAQVIEGRSKDDIRWEELQYEGGMLSNMTFWFIVFVVAVFLAAGFIPVTGLALAGAPEYAHHVPILSELAKRNDLVAGVATTLAPALAAALFITIAIGIVHYAAQFRGSVSVSGGRLIEFKANYFIMVFIAGFWLFTLSALLFGVDAFAANLNKASTVAAGSIYIGAFLLALVLSVAIIAPGLLMLQPVRMWRLLRAQKWAITPRQKFRASYPRAYSPTFGLGACIIAVFFSATLSLLFPLIGPAIALLLLLTLIAHRYLIGYVYGRTDAGQTGGLLQLWLLRRFGTMLSLQPLLLGLIVLSRRIYALSVVLLAAAALIVISVEVYAEWQTREPGLDSLSPMTRDSLDTYTRAIREGEPQTPAGDQGSRRESRLRGSMASVLDMMAASLAVGPLGTHGPVPLPSESIDDLVSTERAARTHPDAPPQLSTPDPAEETAGLLYPPELLAPVPLIWLPNDAAGIARSEAYDLHRYHGLQSTFDIVPEAISERSAAPVRIRRINSRTRIVEN
ncbi:hypothetical protein BOTBODRAFT_308811 [Botryobasidium botryosum FD-172 SS1]|uniref:CSC1/OSCA1-like 7TM region domain-containing protein n=1 Tax=Botryobasidium botryosum (strain FD-172 SS1) TaxID=930990 RepID=A0A067N9M7_BOTB1|nr:hypothetical protein BOTBODRAFT_308811 [Botryobasidium botryosum FD-172 SS1]